MNLYFDNAATSWPKAPGVSEAMADNIQTLMGSPGRSFNPFQHKLLFDLRESMAKLIKAEDSSRIVFGLNATQMINVGLQGILESGDHVLTTSMEHNAVARPLRYLEKSRGVVIDIIRSSSDGFADIDGISQAFTSKTKLVVINHSSNVTGAINDLSPIGQLAKEHDALFMVDCAQTVGLIEIDVDRDRIDMLAGSGHKGLLGPAGIGFLYISSGCMPNPLIFGGTGTHSDDDEQPETVPDRFESGTQNLPGMAGLQAALKYIDQRGLPSIQTHKNHLNKRMLDGLKTLPGIHLYGPQAAESRTMTFSVTCQGKDIAALANDLAYEHRIVTRAGLHCAPWAHKTIGSFPEGTLRISPGIFHEDSDIDAMLTALDQTVRK
ncbi:MAG: aminotransferase class V-fold PLP-dependent enzyme [bacterium]